LKAVSLLTRANRRGARSVRMIQPAVKGPVVRR
jgi:hypothetical protein